jgi:hypothetical protein
MATSPFVGFEVPLPRSVAVSLLLPFAGQQDCVTQASTLGFFLCFLYRRGTTFLLLLGYCLLLLFVLLIVPGNVNEWENALVLLYTFQFLPVLSSAMLCLCVCCMCLASTIISRTHGRREGGRISIKYRKRNSCYESHRPANQRGRPPICSSVQVLSVAQRTAKEETGGEEEEGNAKGKLGNPTTHDDADEANERMCRGVRPRGKGRVTG